MKYLSKKQILFLHGELIKNFGGLDGLRDEKLFDSAISVPFQTFDGHDLYPSLLEKAAQLCYGLVKNHPFIDGNKRIGLHAMLVFLRANNFSVECDDKNLIDLIFRIAGGTLTKTDLLNWLAEHAKFDWRLENEYRYKQN